MIKKKKYFVPKELLREIIYYAKKEVFDDIEDILINYRGDYFKININKFNELKSKHLKKVKS